MEEEKYDPTTSNIQKEKKKDACASEGSAGISAIDHMGRAHAPGCRAHVLAAFRRKEDLLPSPPGPKDGVPAVGQGRCHPK